MRLFLALWPGEALRAALAEVGESLAELASGKPVPAEKIHLTLCFLGEVAGDGLDRVRDAAAGVRAPRFELALDEVGSFRKARVAWAGSSRVPAALAALQSGLDAALRLRGFALEDRPFAAHVTLARKIAGAVPHAPMPALEWRPHDYALVRSHPGTGRYEVMETWPLDRAQA
jgi:2'-5' RNA ligase